LYTSAEERNIIYREKRPKYKTVSHREILFFNVIKHYSLLVKLNSMNTIH